MANPTTVIVGRPNVSKSTIFNRIVGVRISIVEDTPGVIRDRIYITGEWLGREFSIIDVGGIDLGDGPFVDQIEHQVEIAIDEADVIIFVASGREGIIDADELVAKILYRSNRPVILAINKVGNPEMCNDIYEFYVLGLGDPLPISGSHGSGIGDALDEVVRYSLNASEEEDKDTTEFSSTGRPNAGKSSLINTILGEGRMIASDIERMTRDAVDAYFKSEEDQKLLMIDTAGMRKRGKVYESIERYSIIRTVRAIEYSDIILMVLNAEEGIREQGKRAAGCAHEVGRGIIIMVNKWDTTKEDTNTVRDFEAKIRGESQCLDYAPIIFMPALTKQRLNKLPELIEAVGMNQNLRTPSTLSNDAVMDTVAINPTPIDKGKHLKIFYVTQVAIKPPTFATFVNEEELMHFSYARFLENQIRKVFMFEDTPIKIIPRRRE